MQTIISFVLLSILRLIVATNTISSSLEFILAVSIAVNKSGGKTKQKTESVQI